MHVAECANQYFIFYKVFSEGNNTNNTIPEVKWGLFKVGYRMCHCSIVAMDIKQYRVVLRWFLLCTNVVSQCLGALLQFEGLGSFLVCLHLLPSRRV